MASLDVSYDELLNKLESFLKNRGEITHAELVRWATANGVGNLTLHLLLEDLREQGKIGCSKNSILVDEALEIRIPEKVSYLEKETIESPQPSLGFKSPLSRKMRADKPARSRARRMAKRKRPSRAAGPTLLSFFEEEKAGADRNIEREKDSEPDAEGGAEIQIPQAIPEIPLEVEQDEDLKIAIDYLSKYWSVGEIRFIHDLKNLGASNPLRVIEKLLSAGLAERDKLGVINASEKLRKLRRTGILLADII